VNEEVAAVASALDHDPDRRGEAFRTMRSKGQVVPFSGLGGVLAAVSFEAVDIGLRSVENFGGSAGQDDLPEVDKFIAGISEPRHGKVRRIINSVVAFHRSQQIEPYLHELSKRLVDNLVADARRSGAAGADLMEHLAEPIPPAAMARLFGFPEEDSRQYYSWIRESGEKFQRASAEGKSISMADSSDGLSRYVDDRIEERTALLREDWPEDALTRFLVTEVDGERLPRRSIRAQIMFMIGAGSETTRSTIGSLFYRLGRDPDAYAALRRDPSLIDAAIEEALRMDAPAQWMVRTCQKPMDLTGESIERGQKVFMCIGSANHDESVYQHADEFRLDRESRDHLSFGSGPHVCPGAPLARMEIRAAMKAFIDRIEAFHLVDPDYYDAMPTAMLQGLHTLNIVVDAETGN
jgi:cytochrome P450